MPYIYHMITFVESPLFTKQVHDYLTDTEYGLFQEYLASNPGHILKTLKEEMEHVT
jgi:hypothetical protein